MHLLYPIFILLGIATQLESSLTPAIINIRNAATNSSKSPRSNLHRRQVAPLTFTQNIAKAMTEARHHFPQAELLSIRGQASSHTRAGLAQKWEPPQSVVLSLDTTHEPSAKKGWIADPRWEVLRLVSRPQWGEWKVPPDHFIDYSLHQESTPFDINDIPEEKVLTLEDAIWRLTVKFGVTDEMWRGGRFRVFQKPDTGPLAETLDGLPDDVYFEFELEKSSEMGRKTWVCRIFMGAKGGQTFVNPSRGDGGLVTSLPVIWRYFDPWGKMWIGEGEGSEADGS